MGRHPPNATISISDQERDPHSPLVDFFWGHMGWLIYQNKYFGTSAFYDHYVRDLLQRSVFTCVWNWNLMHFWIYLAHAVLFFLAGFGIGWWMTGNAYGGLQFGSSILVWGVIVRTVYVWHITWAVNSVAPMWGYCNYEISDESRNNWIIGLTNNGEGWHNNHHAYPRCAAHGHQWWEFDLTYTIIVDPGEVGNRQKRRARDTRASEHRQSRTGEEDDRTRRGGGTRRRGRRKPMQTQALTSSHPTLIIKSRLALNQC